MQRKKGSNWIEMVIKMVNKFKLTVVHFARPNPMQICACAWIYRWTKRLWKIRTGPPGRRAAGPRGRRGPWAADRWAAGLLLAKPVNILLNTTKIVSESRNIVHSRKPIFNRHFQRLSNAPTKQ